MAGTGGAQSVGEMDSVSDSVAGNGRSESEARRIDRNLTELLQELRVAGLGVQVLFGFLLALPFSEHFKRLSGAERNLYLADVFLATLAIALLSSPVAFHRIAFRRHQKETVLRRANRMAVAGLAVLALAVTGSLVLVVSLVKSGLIVAFVGVCALTLFGVLWFLVPLRTRGHDDY